ncbi:MAG: hypothetical protein ABL957_16540 [Parvularculaceae bacterium]
MLDLKTKDVRARLGEGERLGTVEATRQLIGQRMTPAIRRHVTDSRKQFEKRSAELGEFKSRMTAIHRQERAALEARQKMERHTETRDRAARLPKGLRGLWHRITGGYQEIRSQIEAEAASSFNRQSSERQSLFERQLDQRAVLQKEFKQLRSAQAKQLLDLRQDIGRFLRFTRGSEPPARARFRFAYSARSVAKDGEVMSSKSEDNSGVMVIETALLGSRDLGYFVVDVPNFWERPEMAGILRDVRLKPDKYLWLKRAELPLPVPRMRRIGREPLQEGTAEAVAMETKPLLRRPWDNG